MIVSILEEVLPSKSKSVRPTFLKLSVPPYCNRFRVTTQYITCTKEEKLICAKEKQDRNLIIVRGDFPI